MDEFAGRIAIVTGAAGRLGRAMATVFAEAGMDVVVSDLTEASCEGVAEEVRSRGRRALPLSADVTNAEAVEEMAARTYETFGQANLLVNNAGVAIMRPFSELSLDDWRSTVDCNLMGVIHGVQAFLPRMRAQTGPAHIVNVASTAGIGLASLRTRIAPYVTTKFALVGLTEALAAELKDEEGLETSVLCPGMTLESPETAELPPVPSARFYEGNILDPVQVAKEVLQGVAEGRLHIFTHRKCRGEIEGRHELLKEGLRKMEATAPLVRNG
jgi:NAD(P)-dependent dehydrogenase (short-subunit alcohol dehydrogenase family)